MQNICETTNFFMKYFLSRTGVLLCDGCSIVV